MSTPENPDGLTTTYHVGLPVAAAGSIEVGNIVHIDGHPFTVTKVGGAAFDMVPVARPEWMFLTNGLSWRERGRRPVADPHQREEQALWGEWRRLTAHAETACTAADSAHMAWLHHVDQANSEITATPAVSS